MAIDFQPLKIFMDRLTAWRIPGNVVSVCIDNIEVFRYASGFSDLENGVPMTYSNLFNIYSCSKVATVVAALQLYEKGYFLLDDPLYEYIPEFGNMYIANGKKAQNNISIRNLFTMTSGLSYNLDRPCVREVEKRTKGKMNTLDVIKSIAGDPLEFEPGTKWQYGLSHDVLAAVVEVISGKKFRDYVKENIFEPLGMKDSVYHNEDVLDRVFNQYQYVNVAENDVVKLQAGGVCNIEGEIKQIDKLVGFVIGPEYDSGGAGITTSLNDYSRFASALANGGIGANGERILSNGTIDLLRANHLSENLRKYFNWPQLKGYSYGLGVRTMIDKAGGGSNGGLNEFGWGGAAGATILIDADRHLSMFYTHHMINPQEEYYQPRLRNVLYSCI